MDRAAAIEQPSDNRLLLYVGAGACFLAVLFDISMYAAVADGAIARWVVYTLVPAVLTMLGVAACCRACASAGASGRFRTAFRWTIIVYAAPAITYLVFSNISMGSGRPTLYFAANVAVAIAFGFLLASSVAQDGPWKPLLPLFAGIEVAAFLLFAVSMYLAPESSANLGFLLNNAGLVLLGVLLIRWPSATAVDAAGAAGNTKSGDRARGWAIYLGCIVGVHLLMGILLALQQGMGRGMISLAFLIPLFVFLGPPFLFAEFLQLTDEIWSVIVFSLIYYPLFFLPLGLYWIRGGDKRSAVTWQIVLSAGHVLLAIGGLVTLVEGIQM